MTTREKTLAVAVAGTALLWFGNRGLGRYRAAIDRNAGQQVQAEQALAEANAEVLLGQRARRQLRYWRERSLPTNPEIANSLYQDWLREQLTGAGLEVSQLAEKGSSTSRGQYEELTLDVTAAGTLAQVTDFLYRFYSAVHLHRISGATLTAADGGQKLTAIFTVGALILPECKRTDALAEGEPRPLPAPLEEIRTRLVSRNPFAPPSVKTATADGDKPDAEAAGAFVSGVTYGPRGWELAVKNKDAEVKRFHTGDSIEFGRFKGTVVEIGDRRVVIETDKGKLEVRLGQNLGEAVALPGPAA